MVQELTQIAEYQTLLDSYTNILFDCDGVIWEGDHLIPNVDKVLKHLRTLGKRIWTFLRPRCMELKLTASPFFSSTVAAGRALQDERSWHGLGHLNLLQLG